MPSDMNLQSMPGQNNSDRIFGLDIFRSLAILLVVQTHGAFLLNETSLVNFPYFKMIDGVELFFVLSGFLIGGILLREINSKEKFGIGDLTHFWKRRWLRTLPNYYLILLINYIIVHQGIIREDIQQFNWRFLFFFHNFSSPFYGFFWESWSLSVEEWFYLFTPVLLILFLKFTSPKRSFLTVTLLMIAFPIFWRAWNLDPSMEDFWYDVTFRKVVLMRLDSIAYGLLAAWTFQYFNSYWTKFKFAALLTGIGLIVFILNYQAPDNAWYNQVIYFSITPISAMLLLPFAQSIRSAAGMGAKAITHISKISYSMYLLNLAIVAEVIRDNFQPLNGMHGIMKYVIYWVIVLIGSTLLYKYFETPIMGLRDRK